MNPSSAVKGRKNVNRKILLKKIKKLGVREEKAPEGSAFSSLEIFSF